MLTWEVVSEMNEGLVDMENIHNFEDVISGEREKGLGFLFGECCGS